MATIIISAYRATNSMEQNIDKHYELRQYLKHSHVFTNTVRDCMGYYREDEQAEPSREVSVLAVALSRHHGKQIAHLLATKYEQDAFLLVDNDNSVWLCSHLDGTDTYIGKWTEVTQHFAYANGAFTYYNGHYFIAAKDSGQE